MKHVIDELDGWRIVASQHTTDSLSPRGGAGAVANPQPFPAGRYEVVFEQGGERRTMVVQTEEKIAHFATVTPGVTDIGGYVEILAAGHEAGTTAAVRLDEGELDYLVTKVYSRFCERLDTAAATAVNQLKDMLLAIRFSAKPGVDAVHRRLVEGLNSACAAREKP